MNVSPRRIIFMTVGMLVLVGLTGQFWAVRPADTPRRDFDAAGGLRLGLAAGAAVAPAQSAAMRRLESERGARLRVSHNGLTRVPRTLGSDRPLSPPSSADRALLATGGSSRGLLMQLP